MCARRTAVLEADWGGEKYKYFHDKLCGQGKYAKHEQGGQTTSGVNYGELASIVANDKSASVRIRKVLGLFTKENQTMTENTLSVDMSRFNCEKYKFFFDAPFEISNKCCNVMKKQPAHSYTKETGRKPITAQMADESRLRLQKWLQYGCNAFDSTNPISNPMSFWTEQDVLRYIHDNNLPIAEPYGDIIVKGTADGQMDISDLIGDYRCCEFETTGCDRTGCMFCGYGAHLEKLGKGRFERMKKTHPKQYEWIMKPWNEGGLGYKEVIDWINEHGNMNIRY